MNRALIEAARDQLFARLHGNQAASIELAKDYLDKALDHANCEMPTVVSESECSERENAVKALFAAAPDLLAACKSAHDLLRKLGGTNHDPEYSELAAAIVKAEGR